MGLTVKRVAKLMRNGTAGIYSDRGSDAIRGLRLIVNNKKAAHWELRFQINNRARQMGLGSARDFSLAEARERAKQARQQLADKVDPLQARRNQRAAQKAAELLAAAKNMTFKQCAEKYVAANLGEWSNAKHAQQWKSTLRSYAYPIIGNLPVSAIDTGLVLKVLEQPVNADRGYPGGTLWTARRETASRLRGRIESILGWATVRGYRQGDNPARWQNHIKLGLAPKAGKGKVKVEHHAALAYPDLPAFMAALQDRDGVAARALEFLILTAARTGEVIGAKWSEFDLEGAVWTVPAARMKAGREHKVPLSAHAVALLRSLYREEGNEYLFIGPRGNALSNMAMMAVLRRMDYDVTAHGFRSTFRTWAAEQTGFPREVAEQALAHVISNAVERAYKRTTLFDKRRRLMEAWAKYCNTAPPQVAANVVPMQR